MADKDTVLSDDEILAFMSKLKDNPRLLIQMVEVVMKMEYEAGIREVVDDLTIAVASSTRATEQMEIVTALLRKYDARLREE